MFRSAFVPRAAGGVKPTFILFKGTGFNGVDQLDPSLTINGVTVTPIFRYKGGDANGTNFDPWTYGEFVPYVPAGGAIIANQGSPLLGANDDSVLFDDTAYYQVAGASFVDITTEDIVFECIFKAVPGTDYLYSKRDGAAAGHVCFISSNAIQLFIEEADASSGGVDSAALTPGVWYHGICFINRNENSVNGAKWYINGVASGAGDNLAAHDGSLSNAAPFTIAATNAGANPYSSNIAYLAMWKQSDWHQAGASAPAEWALIAQERFNKLIGIYPARAKGTAAPTIQTRATTAYLDKLENSNTTRKLYSVGDRWMRVVSRLDSASAEVQGYLSELAITNEALQSEDMGTTWAQIDPGDSVGGSVEAPNKTTNTTAGLIPDATDGPHGVSQSITVTAATWAFSVWAKKGSHDWLLIDNDTIANGKVWMDLTNGVVGTQQAGVTHAALHDYGDGWYRCEYTFTGTVAAHTLEIRIADADNTTTASGGDGSTIGLYAWGAQCELSDHHTSYIPTITVALTRSADQLQYKIDDGNLKNVGQGAIHCKVLLEDYDAVGTKRLFDLSDGGASADRMSVYLTGSDAFSLVTAATAGNAGAIAGSTDIADGAIKDVKFLWATDNLDLLVDGASEGTDVSADIPDDLDELDLGMDLASTAQFNGVISDLKILPKRVK